MLLMVGITSYAQTPTLFRKNFNTWSVGTNLSMIQGNTDIREEDSKLKGFPLGVAAGVSLSKQISHFLGVSANFNSGYNTTKIDNVTNKTTYNQLDFRVQISSVNGQILSNYRNTLLFAYTGLGMINYGVKTNDVTTKPNDWTRVIPLGFGAKTKVTSRVSLNVDFGYNFTNTDDFENQSNILSNKDGYYTANVGVQYNLGNNNKRILEWDKPFDYYKPREEHSVDTIVVINRNIDTLYLKFSPDETTAALLDALQKANGDKINTQTINFDFNKWKIKSAYFTYLDDLALDILNGKVKNLVLDGHADPIGSEKNNIYVSQQRAESIKDYLVSKGVSPEKVIIRYHGSKNPISDDNSKNRRVEFTAE